MRSDDEAVWGGEGTTPGEEQKESNREAEKER